MADFGEFKTLWLVQVNNAQSLLLFQYCVEIFSIRKKSKKKLVTNNRRIVKKKNRCDKLYVFYCNFVNSVQVYEDRFRLLSFHGKIASMLRMLWI